LARATWPFAGRQHRDAAVSQVASGLRGLRNQQPECGGGRKNIRDQLTRQITAIASDKALHRSGSKYQPAFPVENEYGVFQVLQQVIDIAAQIGNLELSAAEALSQHADLGGHHG
jgi:hypothetical protein